MEGRMGSLTLRGALPGPQGPAPPASGERPGSAGQQRPLFLAFLRGLQKPGEFGREAGLQVPGPRLKARWPPSEDAGSRGPLRFPPTLQRALLFPERALEERQPLPWPSTLESPVPASEA